MKTDGFLVHGEELHGLEETAAPVEPPAPWNNLSITRQMRSEGHPAPSCKIKPAVVFQRPRECYRNFTHLFETFTAALK